jgi:hypothetical protein
MSDDNVTNIEDHKPVWLNGYFLCVACSHRWVGTCHKDRASKLE